MDHREAQPIVSVILTVKNDPHGCALMLESLGCQTRPADEIVVVDGGSTDNTIPTIDSCVLKNPAIRRIDAPGANIAAGRNIGIQKAKGCIIATIDAGCLAKPEWLERLVAPFSACEVSDAIDRSSQGVWIADSDSDPAPIEWVAGFYRVAPQTLLENVVGLATMRGQLDPVNPETFNPSARSMAFTRDAWLRAGGFPEWLRFSEDTLFDHRLRGMGLRPYFAADAVVHWRPRTSLQSIARQFFYYGTGRGHTQIGAAEVAYNLRNMAIAVGLSAGCLWHWGFLAPLIVCVGYFYVHALHRKAIRVARSTNQWIAYPLCLIVMWIVMASNALGFMVGTVQRIARPERYREPMDEYLTRSSALKSRVVAERCQAATGRIVKAAGTSRSSPALSADTSSINPESSADWVPTP